MAWPFQAGIAHTTPPPRIPITGTRNNCHQHAHSTMYGNSLGLMQMQAHWHINSASKSMELVHLATTAEIAVHRCCCLSCSTAPSRKMQDIKRWEASMYNYTDAFCNIGPDNTLTQCQKVQNNKFLSDSWCLTTHCSSKPL
jgi:hypothetical protein